MLVSAGDTVLGTHKRGGHARRVRSARSGQLSPGGSGPSAAVVAGRVSELAGRLADTEADRREAATLHRQAREARQADQRALNNLLESAVAQRLGETGCLGWSVCPAGLRAGRRRVRPAPPRSRPASVAASRASGPRCGQRRGLLGERARRAPGVVTEQPPDPQPQLYRPAGDWGVDQPAAIPAVHPPRRLPTPRARCFVVTEAGVHDHPSAAVGDRLDDQRAQMRKKHVKITFG